MNGAAARFLRLGASLAGLVLLAWIVTGQAAKPAKHRVSLPTDWSHRHAIFSQPQTAEESARLAAEPRYWQQLYRRQLPTAAVASAPQTFKAAMHRDWAIDLGAGATMGPGNYPAKFGFDVTTASCANDFVVYSTGLQSSGTQASVVGFNNLYSGCGAAPTVNWAYDTAGQILTSPIISLDGTQVAFAETNAGHFGNLVVLKWAAGGSISSPVKPATVLPSAYQACPAPCMTMVDLRDGLNVPTDDTTSSVFYDYKNDVIWVGGARGWLHKITGVFNGTPTEVTTGGFPMQVSTLTTFSPVYDNVSKNVFIGDAGGFLYSVNALSPGVTASGQLDFGAGLVDAPIIDLTKGKLYVFASSDGSSNCGVALTLACSAVYQLNTTFASGDTGTEITVGSSVAFGTLPNPNPMYIGGFDSAFYSSATRTGNLYVCGNTGANPILYQVPITAGALPVSGQGTVFAPLAATGTAGCSPVTDVPNPNTTGGASERIFASVQSNGLSTPCGGTGCIFNFVVAPWRPTTVYSVGQQILNPSRHIETVVSVTGDAKSGTAPPAWTNPNGTTTTDNHVTWITGGILTASPLATWAAGHPYTVTTRILDANGNVEVCTHAGTSGGSVPSFSTVPGSTLPDGTVTWTNAGPVGTFALKVSGGTSGIIEDNVSVGTIAGTSQVYFTTLGNQACTGGTGGCAVQASQPALK